MLKHIIFGAIIGLATAWDNSYISLKNKDKLPQNNVTDVTFRLYSTKYYLPDSDIYEDVIFNEKAQTASLKEDTAFDQTFKTIVIAHGNGGGYKIDQDFWKHYSQAANETGNHYNIIGIRWGSGSTYKHAFVGIKAARVVQSLKESYSLTVNQVHGMGFSFGADVINAMASEIVFSGMDKIGRMTLMDPGRIVKTFKVNGKDQIGFYNKTFASYVDVYHTSTTGVYFQSLGNTDVWINGGQTQPAGILPNSHKAAPLFYARTILTTSQKCPFKGWQCLDPDWKSFPLKDKNKADTCHYGQTTTQETTIVGEYLNLAKSHGNYLLFMDKNYDYCEDVDCSDICY